MARIRSVKPEFWTDQELAEQTSRDARLLYIGLWNLADEHGRLRGDSRYIKGQLFAYDDDLTFDGIDALIGELDKAGKAVRYTVGTVTYLYLPKLGRHQRLEPKVVSRLPPPPASAGQLAPDADQPAPKGTDVSASHANKSAPDADSSGETVALHGAWSMEQGAGSSTRAGDPGPPAPPPEAKPRGGPRGAAAAEKIIREATGCTIAEASAVAALVQAERKPKNLPGLLKRLAADGELGDWLDRVRAKEADAAVAAAVEKAKRGKACVHGTPGGAEPHPVTGKPLCPLCRSNQPGPNGATPEETPNA